MLQLVKKQPSLILARLEGYLVVSVVSVMLRFLSVLRHYYYVVFVFLLIYHNHRTCLMLVFCEFYVQAYPWVPGQPLAAPSSSWWYQTSSLMSRAAFLSLPWCISVLSIQVRKEWDFLRSCEWQHDNPLYRCYDSLLLTHSLKDGHLDYLLFKQCCNK